MRHKFVLEEFQFCLRYNFNPVILCYMVLHIKVKNVCNSMKFILKRYLYQYRKYSTFKIVGFKIFLQGYGQFQNEN